MEAAGPIRTPDQRLRIFVSSTLGELADERRAARRAIETLRLVPVLFELGARPHPPRELYRAYLDHSDVFVGIYWQRYGWVAPGEDVSGLEDEYRLAGSRPRLLYVKRPAPEREPRLDALLERIRADDLGSYRPFGSAQELEEALQQDLALLLSERFDAPRVLASAPSSPDAGGWDAPLPSPLGELVGRERPLEDVVARVLAGVRLLTLTGPGGIGKTRLALAAAAEVRRLRPDLAIAYVPLAAVTDPTLVLATVAARLGVRVAGAEVERALHRAVAGRPTLLVLDNLEQIRFVGATVARLVEAVGGSLQVLATSRTPLYVAGEQLLPLGPLRLPDGTDPDAVLASPAGQLFVARAQAGDPRFTLDVDTAAAVAELCLRLDGVPLALELAAARTRLAPPRTLLAHLGDRLDLLPGGEDRPERHRTLRATIDWSVELLSPVARDVFARLSVFESGATLDAAGRVCDVQDRDEDLLELLGELLDHGLVLVADDRDDDEPRLRMFQAVRAAAHRRLVAQGSELPVRRRHLGWYRELADRAQPYLCGPDQVRWMARIDPERADLRAAVATAMELGDHGAVVELAWDLYVYYFVRGAYQEADDWLRRLPHPARELDRRQATIVATALAVSAVWRGDVSAARGPLEASRATFVELGLPFEAAVAELHLGIVALHEGQLEVAAALEDRAVARFEAIGHDWGVATAENVRGVVLAARRDRSAAGADEAADAARAAHVRALGRARRIGNDTLVAQSLTALAATDVDAGRTADALQALTGAAAAAERARDRVTAAAGLEVLAAAALDVGATDVASRALHAASVTRDVLATPLLEPTRTAVARLVGTVRSRGGATPPHVAPGDEEPVDAIDTLHRALDDLRTGHTAADDAAPVPPVQAPSGSSP